MTDRLLSPSCRHPAAEVEQHHLYGVGVHALLVLLRGAVRVCHGARLLGVLGQRRPEPDAAVDPAAGQEAEPRVGLHAVDDGGVSAEHARDGGGVPVPDEEGAVVGAGQHELAVPGERRGSAVSGEENQQIEL